MTREEVKSCIDTIKTLRRLAYNIHGVIDAVDAENIEKIIKALEQEPCDDAISRQAVLKIIDGWYENNRDIENIEDLIILITYMTSINPQEPKIGHWIKDECGNIICSKCKRYRRDCRYGHTNYCNHCGTKMFEEQESERL